MRAYAKARPHASRRAHARSSSKNISPVRAPQDEDELHLRVHSSPYQTAHVFSFPRPHCCARALPLCFTHPNEGWAERREPFGCSAEQPVGVHVTRHARRLARRLASHDAGRSPLGAPPWRFWAPGAALLSPLPPSACASAGSGSVTASSSQPGRSALAGGAPASRGSGYKPPPQDATPRSAFRMSPDDAPQRARLRIL
jgi:hypothetical protein